ncbi:MAG: hypothetical protein GY827_10590 [Cytophagales bacterium]|nr:hypothetical protein [Cytophagales bacterium]
MKEKKGYILICKAGKCKKKGSKDLIKSAQKFVKKKELEECVFVKESKCLNQCKKAPVVCLSSPKTWLYKQDKKSLKNSLKDNFCS